MARCVECHGKRPGFTLIELMIVITIIMILAGLLIPALARAREQAIRVYCMNNMRQIFLACYIFANEHNDFLPPGAPNGMWGEYEPIERETQLMRNNFICDPLALYPSYLNDEAVFICRAANRYQAKATLPERREWWYKDVTFTKEYLDLVVAGDSRNADAINVLQHARFDPECFTSQLYTYLPYAVATEDQALFLWDTLYQHMDEGLVDFMKEDLGGAEGHGAGDGDTFFRSRVGISRLFTGFMANPAMGTVSDARIPVLYDSLSIEGELFFNHTTPIGGNVLFLDGHTEFRQAPDVFGRIPYTLDVMEFSRLNTHNNEPLVRVPPWCGNRLPDTPFSPRYRYYPNDPLYKGLDF